MTRPAPAREGSGAGPRRAGGSATRAGAAVLLAVVGARLLPARPPPPAAAWTRTNFRGVPVSLTSGPVLAVAGALATSAPLGAAAVAGLGCAAVGRYDDTVGARPSEAGAKGFRGHLRALRRGQVTAGTVKVLGVGVAALLASARLGGRRRPVDVLLDGALVAGAANLANLLDLRPGRLLKVGTGVALATGQPGLAAVTAALLPGDVGERTMLGDTGANALGALLGLGWAGRCPPRGRRSRALAAIVVLTAASEVVSFSRVVEAVPPLRALDRLGRADA